MESTLRALTFGTTREEILEHLHSIQPLKYGSTRNFIDGAVSYLSPYISRGVLSTRLVYNYIIERGFDLKACEKFIQELAWRDYWQLQWINLGDSIDSDLRQTQQNVTNHQIPTALIEARTGIHAVDSAIKTFYVTGYLHNHVRMYIAAMACNVGRCHWQVPAKWMYYHLWDGDWASNALSWQWVAGTNSNKKYVANQENINKYCYTDQRKTFLDIPYSAFDDLEIPGELQETEVPLLKTQLPSPHAPVIDDEKDTALYTYYNLDPDWRQGESLNRVLLLEPSVFEKYPVSEKCIDFALRLAKNIDGVQIAVMEFDEFQKICGNKKIYFKEHPLNQHFRGVEDHRDWMTNVQGDFRSFFAFWKKAQKQLI